MSERAVWRGFLRLAGAVAIVLALVLVGAGGADGSGRVEAAIYRATAVVVAVLATGFLSLGAPGKSPGE